MEIENKKRGIVGLNTFQQKEKQTIPLLSIDPKTEIDQVERLKSFRIKRNNTHHQEAQVELKKAAVDGINIVPSILKAVHAHSTLGEITQTLEKVYGRYRP